MDTAPRRWHFVHRWLGLALGLWFVMVGATGALLVWRDEVDRLLNPSWFRVAAAAPALDLETIVARVQDEHALGWVERVRPPREPGDPLRLVVRAGPARVAVGRIEAFVDPSSGALLGTRSLEVLALDRPHAMRTIYELHRNLLAGEPGSQFVGVAGLLLLVSAVSGAVLAWPRTRQRLARLLAVNWRANAARVALDVHRSAGTLIVGLLLLSTLTGATLVYLLQVRSLVALVSRVDPTPVLPFPVGSRDDVGLALDALRDRVTAAYPGLHVVEMRLPARGAVGVLFQLAGPGDVDRDGDTLVWVDPTSGAAIAERSRRTRSGGEEFMHWLLPLHVGSAFGDVGLTLMALAGAAPLLLLATGGWLWWVKNRRERATAVSRPRRRRARA